MKIHLNFLNLGLLLVGLNITSAQQSVDVVSSDYLTRHAIYDYDESALNYEGSVPDWQSKPNPVKIYGTVYLSDGITPAKDVILYIDQANENGDYELQKSLKKRYVTHRAWVKTNADGQYVFHTFIPGSDRHNTALKTIHLTAKPQSSKEIPLDDFLFDNDKRLRKSCRKKLEKMGKDNILKLESKDGQVTAQRNITLSNYPTSYAKR